MSASVHKIKDHHKQSVTLKELLKDEKKRVRLYFLLSGVLLVILGLLLSKSHKNIETNQNKTVIITSTLDIDTFAQEPVKIDKALTTIDKQNDQKAKNPPVRLTIPALQIDLPVKEAKVVKGYWEVFPDSAAFGLGSSYPDEVGNEVIFAHARDGLFAPLRNAKVGQNITVFTKDKWYSYKINAIKEVLPNQTDVIGPSKDTVLTLYTCSGFSDSKRLIVTAQRI
ncbi:sortase [Candidatus Gottesmanbacteria bacterium]|nr:sortase [Candidatus Gottesmanbacteria bacterium]